MSDETPVERRLREMEEQCRSAREGVEMTLALDASLDDSARRDYYDCAHLHTRQIGALDCGRKAIRLLVIFQHGPSGDAWDEWLANVDALLAKCREDGR